jgi:alkylhydroperoxidase family enzyme
MTESKCVRPLRPPVLTPELEELLRSSKLYREGRPLLVFNALLHHPRAMRALAGKLNWGSEAALTDRERELVILRTVARVRCAQEISVHRVVAERAAGLSTVEVAAILGEINGPEFDARESAFLLIADALCKTDTLNDEDWSRVAHVLTIPELIEAVVVVGYYRMVGGLQNALGVPAEEAFELPDGQAR